MQAAVAVAVELSQVAYPVGEGLCLFSKLFFPLFLPYYNAEQSSYGLDLWNLFQKYAY
jgi:hypothetical protein